MSARFEVVRSDAGHFARFIAANGKEVWRTSEVYKRRQGAENAICVITGRFLTPRPDGNAWVSRPHRNDIGSDWIEVRYLDQRLQPLARPALPTPGVET